jgi:hypothetical protein
VQLRSLLDWVLLPFWLAWRGLVWSGRFWWHAMLATNPITMSLWMMSQQDRKAEEEAGK